MFAKRLHAPLLLLITIKTFTILNMPLTPREQELLDLIRESPMSTPAELARRLGTTRSAVNVHVSSLLRKGALLGRGYMLPAAPEKGVVVVGGANMDFKSRTAERAIPATSNIGHSSQSAGGVGRNIAENLARLGVSVQLIAAVGRDPLGQSLLSQTEAAGVGVRGVLEVEQQPTGTYNAVLDENGELLIAVADMRVTDELTPAVLESKRALLGAAAWIVADGNLPANTLHALLERYSGSARVVYEPVSVPKAAHLEKALRSGHAPYMVTPNVAELAALVGRDLPDTPAALRGAAEELHAQGVEVVWIRRGKQGSLLSTPQAVHELSAAPAAVVDVTGAGDAMLATFLAALLSGQSLAEAARWGHAAAALTVESQWTVLPELSLELVKEKASGLRR